MPAGASFAVGDEVEVLGNEEGFLGSWYLARVKRVRKGPVYDLTSAVFVDDRGNPESETGVTQERLRPPLAAWLESQSQTQCPPLSEYKQFDSVEVLYTDGWWVGYVSKPGSRTVEVDFETTPGEIVRVSKAEELRRAHTWKDGVWVAVLPKGAAQATTAEEKSAPAAAAVVPDVFDPEFGLPEEEGEDMKQKKPAGGADADGSVALIRRALVMRGQVMTWREALRDKSSSVLEELLIGAFVRVHPPEDKSYRILRVRAIEHGLPYTCPSNHAGVVETRRLVLVGHAAAEKYQYALSETSDTDPLPEELKQCSEWLTAEDWEAMRVKVAALDGEKPAKKSRK